MSRIVPVAFDIVAPPGLALHRDTAQWRANMARPELSDFVNNMTPEERAEYERQQQMLVSDDYFASDVQPTTTGAGIVLPLTATEEPRRFDVKKAVVMGLAGLAALGAVGAAAYAASPVDMQGLLPMGADNPGRFGTNWHTSIWAEQDVVTQAMLTLCATNNARPADVSECHEYALNRGQVLTLDNAWSGFQAVPPGGFLWKVDGITPDQVAIFGRSWTPAPSGAPGTLGQGVPSLLIPSLPIVGTSQYVPAHLRDGFRTNIGLFNATVQPSNVLVRIHTGGGNAVAEKTYSLPGLGWQQLNDVFAELGTPAIRNAYVEVVQLTGDRLAVYSSVVDNTSGDPTTFMAKTAYTGQRSLFIPAVAHLPGFNGTQWITDINYLNASNVNQSAAGLGFLAYNQDNSQQNPPSQGWLMGSGEMRTFQDVLLNLFGYTNLKGPFQVEPMDSHLLWARTFNDGGAAGTYGQEYPATFGDTDKISGDLEGILVGLSQSAVGDEANGFRTNIGLLNTGTTTATFHLDLYDDQGNQVGSLDQAVPAMSLFQVDKAYQKLTNNAVNNGRVNVKLTSGQGYAYASIIDNHTGDPTTEYPTIVGPDPVEQYLVKWLDPVLNNYFGIHYNEAADLFNGSYGDTVLQLMYADANYSGTLDEYKALYRGLFNGNPADGEACTTGRVTDIDLRENIGRVSIEIAPNCNNSNNPLRTQDKPLARTTVRNYFDAELRAHPDRYGNYDLNFNPDWY